MSAMLDFRGSSLSISTSESFSTSSSFESSFAATSLPSSLAVCLSTSSHVHS